MHSQNSQGPPLLKSSFWTAFFAVVLLDDSEGRTHYVRDGEHVHGKLHSPTDADTSRDPVEIRFERRLGDLQRGGNLLLSGTAEQQF